MNLPERVLRRSRTKWVAHLLVGVALVAGGVWILPRSPGTAWPAILLGGAVVAFSIATLMPGSSYLRLTPDGFEERVLLRRHKQYWANISCFRRSGRSV